MGNTLARSMGMMATPFKHLLAANMVRVHRTTLGFMGDEQEAREVAQDALLKAYKARDRYDSERPFYPWLYRIVKNTCLDAIARRKNRAVSGLEVERVEGKSRAPDLAMVTKENISRLNMAMDQLEPEQREIINLRHFQDLSYREIADLLGVAEGTVMSRLYRARKALGTQMKEGR